MPTRRSLLGCSLVVFIFAAVAVAQEERKPEPSTPTPLVTASATATRIRFVAPGMVVQLRLEIYNEAGQKVFDTELRGGNVLDWLLQDGAGQRLAAGSYASVVTIKGLSGRLSQRVGLVTLDEKAAALGTAGGSQFSAAQQQSIGPVENNSALKVLQENEAAAVTAVTHDGADGQLARTRGALSFRVGDFFSGKDEEQMRLTESGNLGIGNSIPKFKLDVNGEIRARQGFVFGDGSTLNINEKGLLSLKNAEGVLVPNVAGTGTQNRIAKWIDGSGTLGDSLFSEAGGNVVNNGANIQMTTAANSTVDTNLIFVNGNDRTTGMIASSTPAFVAGNGPYFGMRGNTYNALPTQRGLFAMSAGNVSSPTNNEGSIVFLTGADQLRMSIKPNGNVGIGTATPSFPLTVNGVINSTSGGFRFPDGSTQVTAAAGAGGVSGSGSTGSVPLWTGTSMLGNSIILQSGGLIGIGTSVPSFLLDVAGSIDVGGDYYYQGSRILSSTGAGNLFVGPAAGTNANSVDHNTFVGVSAGRNHDDGTNNTYVGFSAGWGSGTNTANSNTYIGASALGANGLSNATAIGAFSKVTQSNSLVLGSIEGANFGNNPTNVGIGTSAPLGRLQVVSTADTAPSTITAWDARHFVIGGTGNTGGIGMSYDQANNVGYIGTLSPTVAWRNLVLQSGGGKVGIGTGTTALSFKLQVLDSSNTGLRVQTDTAGGTVASFGGNGAFQIDAPGLVGGRFSVIEGGNVGVGTPTPHARLHVVGGSIYVANPNSVIITSPNGVCWFIVVSNAGALSTIAVPCPS